MVPLLLLWLVLAASQHWRAVKYYSNGGCTVGSPNQVTATNTGVVCVPEACTCVGGGAYCTQVDCPSSMPTVAADQSGYCSYANVQCSGSPLSCLYFKNGCESISATQSNQVSCATGTVMTLSFTASTMCSGASFPPVNAPVGGCTLLRRGFTGGSCGAGGGGTTTTTTTTATTTTTTLVTTSSSSSATAPTTTTATSTTLPMMTTTMLPSAFRVQSFLDASCANVQSSVVVAEKACVAVSAVFAGNSTTRIQLMSVNLTHVTAALWHVPGCLGKALANDIIPVGVCVASPLSGVSMIVQNCPGCTSAAAPCLTVGWSLVFLAIVSVLT